MKQETIQNLEHLTETRLAEFNALEGSLARAGAINFFLTSVDKVFVIFLGAFVGTREVASQLIGAANINTVIYTMAGLLIVVLAGLEAAFKWEKSSVELKILATTCRTIIREGTSTLEKVRILATDEEKLQGVEKLLDSLDAKLNEAQGKAAALGINVARDMRYWLRRQASV